jgi:hypothetical protein
MHFWAVELIMSKNFSFICVKRKLNFTNSMEQSPWEANRASANQKKISEFYGTPCFTTAPTTTCHLSQFWARSIQLTSSQPISFRSTLTLTSHLHLGLPGGLFLSGFPTKTLYEPVLSPLKCHMPHSSHSWFDHPNKIWWGVQINKALTAIHFFTSVLSWALLED